MSYHWRKRHHEQGARSIEYAVNAKSPATQDAYRSDWADFVHWCRSRGYQDLPASPQTVAAYLATLADVAKATTVQRRLSAIRCALIQALHSPWPPLHR